MNQAKYRSNLRILMGELKIRTLTELSYLSDVPKNILERIESGVIDRVNHKYIQKLEQFFDCKSRGVYEVITENPDRNASAQHDLRFSKQYTGVVYFIRNEQTGLVKIGFTSDLKQRALSLKQEHKAEMTVLHFISSMDCFVLERVIHSFFDEYREHGEWFRISMDQVMKINADPPKRNTGGAE